MSTDILTHDDLTTILDYDPITGIFTRKKKTASFVIVGSVTGYKSKKLGYLITTIKNTQFYLHRLAWFYVHGHMPKDQVDHINHNRCDNRIANLRVVSKKQNSMNMRLSKSSTTGITGVYKAPKNKWIARIYVNDVQLSLGTFKNKCDAAKARKEAELKYGFHSNHGDSVYHG